MQRHYCCEKQKGIKPRKVRSKRSRRVRPEAEEPGRVWCADSFRPITIRRSNGYDAGSATSMTSVF
jgi:hypothetical protein